MKPGRKRPMTARLVLGPNVLRTTMLKGEWFMCIVINEDGVPIAYAPLKEENVPKAVYEEGDTLRITFDIEITPTN